MTAPQTPAGASSVDDESEAEAPRLRRNGKPERALITELRERRARHKQRNPIVRGAYLIASFTLLLAGVAMLLLPGPAFVVIPIALTLLALEFASAERLLDRALDQADAAKQKARETSPLQRGLALTAGVLAAGAAIAAALYWDIPYLPV